MKIELQYLKKSCAIILDIDDNRYILNFDENDTTPIIIAKLQSLIMSIKRDGK